MPLIKNIVFVVNNTIFWNKSKDENILAIITVITLFILMPVLSVAFYERFMQSEQTNFKTKNYTTVHRLNSTHLSFAERMIEDHDNLVENLLMWTRESNNRLMFVERPGKYDVFRHPEVSKFNVSKLENNLLT